MLSTSQQKQESFRSESDYYSIVAKGPMLDRVYSMRYRGYSAENYIEENSSHKFIDEYDAKPNGTCYLTYCGKKLMGTIRTCVYTPEIGLRIPIMDVFEDELKSSIGLNSTFVEPNKFVIDPSFQTKGGVRARFSVLSNIVDSADKHNAKYLVAGIRSEHIKFYKGLHFEVASGLKAYPHLSFKTVLVIVSDVDAFRNKIFSKLQQKEVVNDSLFNNVSG
jgi:hypothetical protein